MSKGTPSFWVTSVSEITPQEVYVRGYPMTALVGQLSFSALTFLLVRGELPTPGQARMMDVILSSILDYGLQKSGTLAGRAVASVNPSMTAGLGAAMLGAGAALGPLGSAAVGAIGQLLTGPQQPPVVAPVIPGRGDVGITIE